MRKPRPKENPPSLEGSKTITLKRSRFYLFMAMIPLAFALGIGAGSLVWQGSSAAIAEKQAGNGDTAARDEAIQNVKRISVQVDDDPAIGPENAPITIIEFSDYQCPYCQRWHDEVYAKLLENYGDKVRLVYRDFPLYSIHPEAGPAAEAANCANEQGSFWSFHERLFSYQYQLGREAYQNYASELGLDIEKFKICLESGRYKAEVDADYQYATSLGITSTPTFFINGIPLVGAQPYDVFQYLIDKELAGEIPK